MREISLEVRLPNLTGICLGGSQEPTRIETFQHPCGSVCQTAFAERCIGQQQPAQAPRRKCRWEWGWGEGGGAEMLQNAMQAKHCSIVDGSLGPVSKQERIQLMVSGCLEKGEDQALQHFDDHSGQSNLPSYPASASRCWDVLSSRGHWFLDVTGPLFLGNRALQ